MAERNHQDLFNLKDRNIVWSEYRIVRADREKRNKHKPGVLWFTGLSGSGKSTIANAVDTALFESGHQSYVLDGDNIRHGLNRDLSFTPTDRTENIRRIAEVAKLFCDAGFLVLTAFISPFRADRTASRTIIGTDQFIEVFVDAPIEVCKKRDPKGLYEKAIAGEIADFTGITSPYEPPERPEIVLKTEGASIDENVKELLRILKERNFISK